MKSNKIANILVLTTLFAGFWPFSVIPAEIDKTHSTPYQIPEDVKILDSVKIDSSKIYRPSPEEKSDFKLEPAKIKILETKNKTTDSRDVIPDPVSAGLHFLVQNQNADGSFSNNSKTRLINTFAATEILGNLNQKISGSDQPLINQSYPSSTNWLNFSFPENNDYLAQKISVLAEASEEMSDPMDYLAGQINETNLAFGFKKQFSPDVITTARVLKAIAKTNYQDAGSDSQFTLKAALLYILNSQSLDGGWPEIDGETSSIYATNIILEALRPYQNITIEGLPGGDTILPTKINLGFNFLKSNQYFWGSWQDNLLLTALSLNNFLSYAKTPTYYDSALTYLKNSQSPDGSFDSGNIFTSSKAVKSLAYPDVAVVDIQNPLSVPNPSAVIWATIENKGYLNSDVLNLSAAPSAFSLFVDGEEVNLDFSDAPPTAIFEPGSQVIFQIEFSKPIFGEHDLKFKINHPGPEFYKNNNELTKPIAFDSEQFSGPQPPPWLGASSGSGPGEITLRWQQSNDPNRDHYVLYGSSASGLYNPDIPLYIFPPGNFAGITFYFDNPADYDKQFYFTIVSFDSSGNRGNYSKESYAKAYADPENYRGTVSGRVFDKVTNQNLADVELSFFLINEWYTDASGNYSINYYPGFYLNSVYKTGYYSDVSVLEIKTQTTDSRDFGLDPLSDYTPPAPVSNLRGVASDGQIRLDWDAYSPPPDFKEFRIYRSNTYFYSQYSSQLFVVVSSSAATSFTDNTISNGINYYYAVVPRDTAGGEPSMPSLGPFKGNSRPVVSNFSASQSDQSVNLYYDLSDQEGDLTFAAFEFWNGSNWQEISDAIGEGSSTPGSGKLGIWNAKSEFPNFSGESKIRIKTWNDGYFADAAYFESNPFNLDTLNPTSPTVNNYFSPTNQFHKTFSGTKEANSSVLFNNQTVAELSSSTDWFYAATLQEGENNFTVTSKDAFKNQSVPTQINITYDPNSYTCGDVDNSGAIDVSDIVYIIQYIFNDGPAPSPLISADVDLSGSVDVSDAVYFVQYIFNDGPAPCEPNTSFNREPYLNWNLDQINNYLNEQKIKNR